MVASFSTDSYSITADLEVDPESPAVDGKQRGRLLQVYMESRKKETATPPCIGRHSRFSARIPRMHSFDGNPKLLCCTGFHMLALLQDWHCDTGRVGSKAQQPTAVGACWSSRKDCWWHSVVLIARFLWDTLVMWERSFPNRIQLESRLCSPKVSHVYQRICSANYCLDIVWSHDHNGSVLCVLRHSHGKSWEERHGCYSASARVDSCLQVVAKPLGGFHVGRQSFPQTADWKNLQIMWEADFRGLGDWV